MDQVRHIHWGAYMEVLTAVAIVGVAWLAAQRTSGWRLPAWCAGLAMGMTGAVSMWLPGWVSSFDRVWGAAALAWGITFIVIAELTARGVATGGPAASRPSPPAP